MEHPPALWIQRRALGTNYSAHYNWCRRVPMQSANKERNARQNQQRQCIQRGTGRPPPPPSTGSRVFCDRYARTAISQQRQNLNRRCGHRGGRWQTNYNNHNNWCLRENRVKMKKTADGA